MSIEQTIGLIQATMEDLEEQLENSRDLSHYFSVTAARSTYLALLACLEPVRDMIGPEVSLQSSYLEGVTQAWETASQLLRRV